MHLIVICIDSLRQDHVSFYAGEGARLQTPNIDAFAEQSVVFDNMYPEALPTIPIRTQLMTGQRTLGKRPWKPLERSDRTLAHVLGGDGYVCAFITDVYHYFKPDYNFHRDFHVWRWIRGQEFDPYRSQPLSRYRLEDFLPDHYPPEWPALVRRCLQNTESFETADDHFCAQLVRETSQWLEENRAHDQIFLWFDSFDPHEPWTPPPEFDRFTDPGYRGPRLILPPGGPVGELFTEEQIDFIRGLYVGEVAYVDHYVGSLLDKLRELELLDQSIVVLLADHGHPLADHGHFLKGAGRLYSELLKVPFMIRLPGAELAGRRITALAQFHDLMPTLLDLLNVTYDPDAFGGRSLAPLMRGDVERLREAVIMGYDGGNDRCIRTEEWSLILRSESARDELYNLRDDPGEQRNRIETDRQIADYLEALFGTFYSPPRRDSGRGVQGKDEVAGTAL